MPKQKGSSDLHDYIFTGVGCSDLAEKIGGKWLDLFKYLKDFGVNFRRIDIALDDFNNPALIDFPRIERKLQRKEFRSSKRQYNILRDVSTSGELAGESVYLGSRGGSNHSLLRIYQKYLQMVGKHEESQMPLEALKSGSWIRWELEITKDKANAMIDLILRNQSISKAIIRYCVMLWSLLIRLKQNRGRFKRIKPAGLCAGGGLIFYTALKKLSFKILKRPLILALRLIGLDFRLCLLCRC